MASVASTSTRRTSTHRKPQELLICGICEEPYDEGIRQAKFLACHHTFCCCCLDTLSRNGNIQPAYIQCPNCRAQTRVPQNGARGLQTNFYVTSLKEFSEPTETQKPVPNVMGCQGHNSLPTSYFCVTCGVAICADCKTLNHQATTEHSVIRISEAETAQLEELNVNQKTLTANNRNLQIIAAEMVLLTAAKDTAIDDMETCISLLREHLQQRRCELMNCILDQYDAKQSALLDKQTQIQEANEELHENITEAKYITMSGDLRQLKRINESLKKVKEETKSVSSSLDLGRNFLTFDSTKGIDAFKQSLHDIGQVYSKDFLPSTFAFRKGDAKAGETTTYSVEVQSHHGEDVSLSSRSFSLKVTDPTDTEVRTILNTSGAECTMTFTPQMSGLHKVSGTFLGQQLISELTHISVHSNNPVLKFGDHGDGHGTFTRPWGIAIDNNNCLYVADPRNKLIQKFTDDGKFLKQFSVADEDEEHSTCDITLDIDKELVLCTQLSLNNRKFREGEKILIFTFEGELKDTFTLSDECKAFYIAIDGYGDIILSNQERRCLFKVDKDGNFLNMMGPPIVSAYITISNDGTIIVPDKVNDCIYLLNEDGTVKHRFGTSGTGKGELFRPSGVAADNDYILVSEFGNNRVQIFKHDGTFVSMIESTEDPLNHPRGLAVTKDGYVYVVDSYNNCIKKYKYRDVQWLNSTNLTHWGPDNENVWISIKFSLQFVPKGPVDNKQQLFW